MFDALYISATGMQAQQANVDNIANNLANSDTPGFKKARVSFTDMVMREALAVQPGAAADGGSPGALAGLPGIGSGVAIASVVRLFETGDLKQTGSPYDVAIQGDGFLEISMPDGTRTFTRGGTLKVNADGLLATQAGYPLKPRIAVPAGATSMSVLPDGRVQFGVPGRATPLDGGQLELVRFSNPGALVVLGGNLYRASEGSGEPAAGRGGQDGLGQLTQGFLEGSNVKMVDEMVGLMVAQRAYEANVKVIQASDEMLGLVNNLRK
jgi:flagellar basal-body rod protein FlgG